MCYGEAAIGLRRSRQKDFRLQFTAVSEDLAPLALLAGYLPTSLEGLVPEIDVREYVVGIYSRMAEVPIAFSQRSSVPTLPS